MKRIVVVLIVALSVLGGIGIMYASGATQSAIVALLVGLVLARLIPWLMNIGFENEIVMLKNRLLKLFHLKHENIIGFPDNVEDGVMYYKTRSRLPLKELLNKIDERMDMLALSFTVIVQHIDDIRSVVASGKRITFLVLDPKSKYVSVHSKLYSDASNLESQINTSLDVLWNLKNDYPENVTIKIYDHLAPLAIIVIDDKIIKVEDRLVGRDSNTRPSHLSYKTSDAIFFDRYYLEYDRILKISSDYHPS